LALSNINTFVRIYPHFRRPLVALGYSARRDQCCQGAVSG